jgi:hypothetical protein
LVRIKRALKRQLSVRAQKRIKSIIGSVFELIDRMRGKGKPSRVLPDPMPSKSLNAGDLVRVVTLALMIAHGVNRSGNRSLLKRLADLAAAGLAFFPYL